MKAKYFFACMSLINMLISVGALYLSNPIIVLVFMGLSYVFFAFAVITGHRELVKKSEKKTLQNNDICDACPFNFPCGMCIGCATYESMV